MMKNITKAVTLFRRETGGTGERMKMLALRSLVLILAALISFVRTGLSRGKQRVLASYRASLSPKARMSAKAMSNAAGNSVNDFDEIDSNLRLVLTPRTKLGVLRLGAEWERFSFGFPEGAALPNTLQSFSTIIGLDMQFSDSIIIRAEGQPGLYNSGLGHLYWDDFNLPFVIGGTYIFSPNLQLVLGVSVDVERSTRSFLPQVFAGN